MKTLPQGFQRKCPEIYLQGFTPVDTRARFGTYDTIDFVVVLIGYALSGEPALKAFYERLSSGSLFTTSGDHTKAWDIVLPINLPGRMGFLLSLFYPYVDV